MIQNLFNPFPPFLPQSVLKMNIWCSSTFGGKWGCLINLCPYDCMLKNNLGCPNLLFKGYRPVNHIESTFSTRINKSEMFLRGYKNSKQRLSTFFAEDLRSYNKILYEKEDFNTFKPQTCATYSFDGCHTSWDNGIWLMCVKRKNQSIVVQCSEKKELDKHSLFVQDVVGVVSKILLSDKTISVLWSLAENWFPCNHFLKMIKSF